MWAPWMLRDYGLHPWQMKDYTRRELAAVVEDFKQQRAGDGS